jgi:hypothetical protein
MRVLITEGDKVSFRGTAGEALACGEADGVEEENEPESVGTDPAAAEAGCGT